MLSVIPLQIQLTVFEEDSIDAILMRLEGENIAISHSSQTQAIDFIFSRDALYAELGRTP